VPYHPYEKKIKRISRTIRDGLKKPQHLDSGDLLPQLHQVQQLERLNANHHKRGRSVTSVRLLQL
jgi:hypothetical protein